MFKLYLFVLCIESDVEIQARTCSGLKKFHESRQCLLLNLLGNYKKIISIFQLLNEGGINE